MRVSVEVLPPEHGKENEEFIRFVSVQSRRGFRKTERWGYDLLKRIEDIVYWSIPSYREGIIEVRETKIGALTGYHQWILVVARKAWNKIKDEDKLAEFLQGMEEQGYLSHSAFAAFFNRLNSDYSNGNQLVKRG
jgi:hypothetical protein